MKTLKIVFVVVLVLVVAITGFLAYSGFFATVTIQEKEVGPYNFVGIERLGDYSQSHIYMDSVFLMLKEMGIETTLGFGIYRDDPSTVATEKLQSMVGCIIDDKDLVKSVQIQRKGLLLQKMGATTCIVVEYPFKNPMSIFAAIIRVYPKLKEYVAEKQYLMTSIVEVYDTPAEKLTIFTEIP